MDLEALVTALTARKAALPAVDKAYCEAHEIKHKSTPPDFYVQPSLTGSTALSPVLLISAPAAVGKTTLARHLHAELGKAGQGALYIPLQHASIGQDFFTGRLAGVFPGLSKRQFLDAVFGGDIVLLFDGYDEVTMRSDQIERNKHFIDEIVKELDEFEARGGKARPSLVFLFRSVFADFGVFDALLPRAASLSVDFFDQFRRKQFLSKYLDRKAATDPAKRPSKGHLSSAFLDGFENTLSRAKDEAAAFFGHAIVLGAFGDFLHEQEEQNAARLAASLTGDEAVEATAVTLLSRIMKNILERETGKFPNSDYASLLPTFAGYSISVQETLLRAVAEDDLCRRGRVASPGALAKAIGAALNSLESIPGFSQLDPLQREQLLSNYRRELDSRITHHPFVDFRQSSTLAFRNPVYREYYLARLVASDSKRNWDIVTRVNDCSHYLGLFFLHSVDARELSGHEQFLFHLVSLLATSSSGNDFLFKLQWKSDEQRWIGTVEAPYLRVDPFFVSNPALTISIPLQGVLQNAAFMGGADCLIDVVGPGPEHAHTDPIVLRDCLFESADVNLNAASIRFEGILVAANRLHFSDIVSSLHDIGTMSVRPLTSTQVTIKMSDYARERWGVSLNAAIGSSDTTGEERFRRKLSKLLLWFRKHGRADYGCYDKKFQTCALNGKKDAEAVSLSDFLFEAGYLSKDESLIVMNQKAFAHRDIYYGKQNAISFGPKAKGLYDALVATPLGRQFR